MGDAVTFDRPPANLKPTTLQRKVYRVIAARPGATTMDVYVELRGKHRPIYINVALETLEHLRWIASPDSRHRSYDRRWRARTDMAMPAR